MVLRRQQVTVRRHFDHGRAAAELQDLRRGEGREEGDVGEDLGVLACERLAQRLRLQPQLNYEHATKEHESLRKQAIWKQWVFGTW